MGIGSISFWQQDQNFWSRAQGQTQAQARTDAVMSAISSAMTNESQGLASIANQTALTRVNNQLSAAIQSVLSGTAGSSTSSGSSSSSSSSSSGSSSSASSAPPPPPPPDAPASGTSKASLLTSTSLLTLGVLKKGQITVYDGTNTTTYTSTGSDTVGDLINAINANKFGNADVAAGLNADGQLTITAKDNTKTITIGGAFAPNIGFGGGNDTFSPTPPPATSTSSNSASSSSTAAGTSATGTNGAAGTSKTSGASTKAGSATPPSGIPINSAFALQTGGTAAMLLASDGGAGSVVNLLA